MPSMPGFRAWNDGNVLADHDGLPRIWFHGSDAEADFNVFASWDEAGRGFHFSTLASAHGRLAIINRMGPPDERLIGRLIPAVARARNPLRLRDHHAWRIDSVAEELASLGVVTPAVAESLQTDGEAASLFAALEMAGHDAVVYANAVEGDPGADSLMACGVAWAVTTHPGPNSGAPSR